MRLDVCHEQLRIGDDLEEQRTGLIVNQRLYFFRFYEVGKARFHTKAAQGVTNQRDAVAKQMFRGHDVQSCATYCRQGVGDRRHTCVQCRHAGGSCDLPDALLQIRCRGVGDAGVRRRHGTTAKCVAHGLGRLKLKRRRIIDVRRPWPWQTQTQTPPYNRRALTMPRMHQASDTSWLILSFRTSSASNDLADGDDEFIHILAGVVEGEGGTDAHLIAEGPEGGLGAVMSGTHCDALLI